jgi:hypothetical protein
MENSSDSEWSSLTASSYDFHDLWTDGFGDIDSCSLDGSKLNPSLVPMTICHRRTESAPAHQCSSNGLDSFLASLRSPSPRSSRAASQDSNAEFQSACSSQFHVFNPRELGFLPLLWPERRRTFGQLVEEFFRRKSGSNTRFVYKLFNALRITNLDSSYFDLVGVAWVTDRILKVDKFRFARLLGIRSIDGSLFHKQGNFPSHGFVELAHEQAMSMVSPELLQDIDFDIVRLMVHEPGDFFRGCGPDVLSKCPWFNSRKKDKSNTDEDVVEQGTL